MFVLGGLALFQGKEIPARILIDSGSTQQYVSTAFISKYSLPVERDDGSPHWVQVANGTYMESTGSVDLTLAMDRYQTRIHAKVLDMPEYDVILGLDWLQTANPVIDWQDMSIQVREESGTIHELSPQDPVRYVHTQEGTYAVEGIDPISVKGVEKMLRCPGAVYCLFNIRPVAEEKVPTPSDLDLDPISLVTTGHDKAKKILANYRHVFREDLPPELPPTRELEHRIDTGDASPINLNAYPLSPVHLAEQSRQLSQMLTQGIIQESSSPWGFPVLFVKKPGGKWRMCIDYRALNAVTRKNGYPLPRISECCDLIGRAKVLSKLDLTQGYYQVQVAPEDREKTAFNTREGKFEYRAMPFGLANAPATFQTLMNRILRKCIARRFVIVYLDDIVIFSNSVTEHCEHLTEVLTILADNKLYAKPTKSVLMVTELEFCGHLVGNGKLQPLRSKVQVITDWPVPQNVHEMRQFLGLATFYRRFIRDFAKICVPLFELLKEVDAEQRKKRFRKITWNATCELAFCKLKEALTSGPTLLQPDTTLPFIIETDASEWAIGCVLLQEEPGSGKLHPVAYDGRKLSPAEVNYPVHEKELLAVKNALQIWRIYIDNGHTTIIYTDHESLKYLATMRNPTKRLARWIEEFGEYNVDLRYRRGRDQVVPDAISRRPDLMGEGPRNIAHPLTAIRGVEEDEWANHLLLYLEEGVEPPEPLQKDIHEEAQQFTVHEGTLYRLEEDGESPYTPQILRNDLLEKLHNEYGHLNHPGIQGIVTGRGWWHSRTADIKKFVSYCPQCQIAQRSKTMQDPEAPQTLNRSSLQIFDRWAIDLIGILPKTPAGNRWIVTAIEYLTGWPVAAALPDARAETVAAFVHNEIAMVYGPPKELLSDNGKNLVGAIMQSYTTLLRSKHRITTPYHPRTNGKVENFNGFLGATLTKLLVNQPVILWDQYLAQALFAVRVRVHATSRYSPYMLLFGRHPRLPTDENDMRPMEVTKAEWDELLTRVKRLQHARMVANERLVKRAIEVQKMKSERVKPTSYIEGDWVLVRAEARYKFEGRWFGPYRIVKVMPLGTYRLADPDGNLVLTLINGQRLTSARVTDETQKVLWNSSRIQGALRRRGVQLDEPSPEVAALFEKESEITDSYRELATIPEEEWRRLESRGLLPRESKPSREDYGRLEEGLKEGLSEPQPPGSEENTAQLPGISGSQQTPLVAATESMEVDPHDTLDPMEITATTEDILEPVETTDIADQMDSEPVEVTGPNQPWIPKKKKNVPSWLRESTAGFGPRNRKSSGYGLRSSVNHSRNL